MIKEIKKVEAVVVYGVDLREWKGKLLKACLVDAGVTFEKSNGALVIEANDENVAEIVKYVEQSNYKYNVDTVIEYVEEEEKQMKRYLLNTTTNVICVAGDVAVTDYKKYTFVEVMAEEVEVEGGFAIIGTKENGEVVEAFLSEEAYFEGKEFRVGRKVPRKAEASIEVGTKVKVVAEVGYKGLEGVVVGEAYTSRTDGKKALIVEVEKVGRKYLEVEEVEAVNEKQEVVTKKVVKSKIKAVKDIVAVNRIPYTNKEGKELTYLYAIGEEAIEETLEELEKIAGLVATLERYDYIEGRLGQITVRHDGSRGRSNTILEIYILKEDKEEEPTVEEEEVEIVAEEEEEAFVGKAVKRVILDGIKIAKQVIEGMESGEIEFDHETYNYYKYERIPRLELDLENILK